MPDPQPTTYDPWLRDYYGELLDELDARCRSAVDYRWFRELDDDLWAVLLSKHYSAYPNLRQALPDLPPRALQQKFTGTAGIELATRSKQFYRRLKDLYGRYGAKTLSDSRVLDFGCGWGRLTRYLARDVEPGNLFGCDPNPRILAICKQTRVPARFAISEEVPSALPFSEQFDLVFAFSVFTHLSEEAHEACLRAIHDGLARGGILIVTVRPAAYLNGETPLGDEPAYAFTDTHPGGNFGEAVINLPYIRERWRMFSLLDVSLQIDSINQVVVTLRRNGTSARRPSVVRHAIRRRVARRSRERAPGG